MSVSVPVVLGDGAPVVLLVSDAVRELVVLAVDVAVGVTALVTLTEAVAVGAPVEVSEVDPVGLLDDDGVPVRLTEGDGVPVRLFDAELVGERVPVPVAVDVLDSDAEAVDERVARGVLALEDEIEQRVAVALGDPVALRLGVPVCELD